MDYKQVLQDRLAESLDPEMQERYKKRRADAVAAQAANYQAPGAIDALADGQRMHALQTGLTRAANKFGSVGGDGGQKTQLGETLGAMDEADQGAFKAHQVAYDKGVQAEDDAMGAQTALSDRGVKLAGSLDAAERTGVERGREDAKYGREQGMQADEDALDSDVSRSYQALAKKYSPGTDFSKMPASRIKALIPSIERAYTIDEQSKAKVEASRQWAAGMAANRNDRVAARAESAAERRAQQERDLAFKREEREAKASEAKANPKPLGTEAQKRKDDAQAASNAINGMEVALANGDNTFSIVGDNDYTQNEKLFEEYFGRLQSGGAIGIDEGKRFRALLPRATDSKEMQQKKITRLKQEMTQVLAPYAGGAASSDAGGFPRTVQDASGQTATVSNAAELKEAQAEGFK